MFFLCAMSLPELATCSIAGARFAASSLSQVAGFFWENQIFTSDRWNGLMNGLRIGLAVFAAFFLLYEMRARRQIHRAGVAFSRTVRVAFVLV
jgi:hypothetical protein